MDKKRYERPVIIKQYSGLMNKFGSSPVTKPMTEIDGIPIRRMVDEYGSPLFVFSEKKIRENYRKMYRLFKTRYPKVQFSWSYKTNYMNAVCSVFHQEGALAEVVSGYEYDRARRLGVEGRNIIFNGPDKNTASLERAIKESAKIHIDHFDELFEIIELTEKMNADVDVAIRVNMDTGIYPKWDRFGFNYENGEAMDAIKRIIKNPRLHLTGLHTHIGTYIMSADPYRVAASKLVNLANEIYKQYNIVLDYIDMGGGIPSNNTLKGQYLQAEQILPSLEDFADAITSPMFDLEMPHDELPTLYLENGRSLIDDAGYLISSVIANKRLSDGKRAVIIDAGVNYLFTSHWFNHKIVPGQQSGEFTENSAVYGPLCMNIDCLRENIVIPSFKKGDLVVILYVGAYSVTQWMQFITLRPNVIMVMEDGETELIRENENIEYINSLEKVPEILKNFSL
ncbi:MAG: alanine racemase [Melioribacteraceae bacterium]|nr:alanine racemase [Melioribacteraceae bacterium]MCF8395502.1 alanine racemase [Melioribacteraceae bacterium]MCF8420842.1 alanine racemase [Melioribacteraceae bacterium]